MDNYDYSAEDISSAKRINSPGDQTNWMSVLSSDTEMLRVNVKVTDSDVRHTVIFPHDTV